MGLGKILKKFREDNGLTYHKAALLCNMTGPSFESYEKEKRIPTNQAYLKLSKGINCSIDYLRNGDDNLELEIVKTAYRELLENLINTHIEVKELQFHYSESIKLLKVHTTLIEHLKSEMLDLKTEMLKDKDRIIHLISQIEPK